MECIFCKIVNGEIPSSKILENDKFLAFKDINPSAPIHILIIPKAHVENFDKAENIYNDMAEFIKEVAKKLDITDYRLVTNNGKNAGQEVFHFHVHLLANPNDKLKWPKLV